MLNVLSAGIVADDPLFDPDFGLPPLYRLGNLTTDAEGGQLIGGVAADGADQLAYRAADGTETFLVSALPDGFEYVDDPSAPLPDGSFLVPVREQIGEPFFDERFNR